MSEEGLRTIIGASLTPTAYKIRTPLAEHYLRCGADIFLNGLQIDLEGEGRCIVCGSTTLVKMKNRQFLEVRPSTAILHVVEKQMGSGRLGIVCEASPLFDKETCLRDWLKEYRGTPGTVYKPQEFLDRMLRTRLDVKPIGPA